MINKKITNFFITLYIIGILSGIVLSRSANIKNEALNSGFGSVLNTFCINYWMMFLIIITPISLFGIIINTLIVYVRGFSFGVFVYVMTIHNFKYLVITFIIDLVFFLLIMFIILNNKYKNCYSYNLKLLLYSLFSVLTYSLLIEMAGGLIG